jgi:catechol 2,3-dioxygenase-like lactoylglutathione lyase family enzyme
LLGSKERGEEAMICALQHVGLGVTDAAASYGFYKKCLGFNLKISDYLGSSPEMEPIIGELAKMRIIMGLSSQGRGVVELVQHLSSKSRKTNLRWGDIGFLASGYHATNLPAVIPQFEQLGFPAAAPIRSVELGDNQRMESIFLKDPDGNFIELIDAAPGKKRKPTVSGLAQVTIGVRDMDRSIAFYREIVGFDRVLFDNTGTDAAFDALFGGELKLREVLLGKSHSLRSPFLVPNGGRIRLIQALNYKGKDIYKGRRWGDIGQMECCFEVKDAKATIAELKSKNIEIYHPPTFMNMGSGSCGYFTYIKDPDGNLVEFVEVSRVAWLGPKTLSLTFNLLSPVLSRLVR